MKTKNFLLAAALFLGSLVFNSADISAQTPIRPLDPSFQDGVEKYVGTVMPGGRDTIRFYNVGFVAGTGFKDLSLAVDTAFFISDFHITGQKKDTLYVTFGFTLRQYVVYGQDFTDTLTIRANNLPDFVLPLRGSSVSFWGSPASLSFAQQVARGDTSDLSEPVVIFDLDLALDNFVYWFNTDAFYAEIVLQEGGIPPTLTVLDVWFTPPAGDLAGTVFYDTLSITDRADTTGWVQKIPVYGRSTHVKADPSPLDFGGVPEGNPKTLDLNVEVNEASLGDIVTTDSRHFRYVTDPNWDPSSGGTIHVTFNPDAVQDYNAYLIIRDDAREPLFVRLKGEGKLLPVLSADPEAVDFGTVAIGTVETRTTEVTLTNPLNQLDYNSFSITGEKEGIFSIISVEPVLLVPETDVVNVTLSFNPNSVENFTDTLLVKADYAEDLKIELTGTGTSGPVPPVPSPQQAAAISGQAAATAPALSVKEGDIIVSRAPAGSSIQVYDLQGKALKTQSVVSDAETVKTASFPRSVYIVLVNDKNQEILRQKVVL